MNLSSQLRSEVLKEAFSKYAVGIPAAAALGGAALGAIHAKKKTQKIQDKADVLNTKTRAKNALRKKIESELGLGDSLGEGKAALTTGAKIVRKAGQALKSKGMPLSSLKKVKFSSKKAASAGEKLGKAIQKGAKKFSKAGRQAASAVADKGTSALGIGTGTALAVPAAGAGAIAGNSIAKGQDRHDAEMNLKKAKAKVV